MRKVYMLNRISLDGFFASADDTHDWFIPDPAVDAATHQIISSDTLLLGRISYKHLEDFWPHAAEAPDAPEGLKAMAAEVNGMTKWVFSTTRKEVTWENSVLKRGDLINEIKAYKQGSGPGMLILGSGTLVQQISNEGLIDEYVLIVTPIILGAGKLLFKDVDCLPLTLVSAQPFASGNTVMHYSYKG
jgi:dihydrofolate reductase